MINWISVKEKLPDEWVDVLAFHENGASGASYCCPG